MKKARQNFVAVLLLCMGCWLNVSAGNLVVGDYGGEAGVSPSGAAVYTIPVECPKGVNGMEPVVALAYNSQSGMGNAGWGWNLSATSVIMKTCATPYYDGKVLPISDVSTDYLVLDGQRLIKYKDLGNDETEFRTENDHYDRIIRKGKSLEYSFTVYTTSGRKLTYSQLKEGSSWYHGNLGWYLTEVEDLWGNYMTYEYWVNAIEKREWNIDEVRLTSISYGGNKTVGTKHVCKVEFTYDHSQSDIIEYYIGGYKKYRRKMLSEVSTYSNDVLNSRYVLTYENAMKKDYLVGLIRYGSNGDYLKSISVEWNKEEELLTESIQQLPYLIGYPQYNVKKNSDKQWFVADYNSDGFPDLLSFSIVIVSVGRGKSSEWWLETYLQYYRNDHGSFSYDKFDHINGLYSFDGKYGGCLTCNFTGQSSHDIILPCLSENARTFRFINVKDMTDGFEMVLNASHNEVPAYSCADLNKDGYDDIVIVEKSVNPHCIVQWGGPKEKLSDCIEKGQRSDFNIRSGCAERVVLTDVNSDGMTDILIVTREGYTVMENRGNSTGTVGCKFVEVQMNKYMKFNHFDGEIFLGGDFNGDGSCDFYKVTGSSTWKDWTIYFGDGKGKFQKDSGRVFLNTNGYEVALDMNNDGQPEVLDFVDNRFDLKRYNSLTKSFNNIESKQMCTDIKLSEIVAADFDGDGVQEVLSVGKSIVGSSCLPNCVYLSKLLSDGSAGKVKGIKTPLHDIAFSYSTLMNQNIYGKTGQFDDIRDIIDLSSPIVVLCEVKKDDVSTSYTYEDALFETTGKGFLGFGGTKTKSLGVTTSVNCKLNRYNGVLYPSHSSVEIGGTISKETDFNYSIHSASECPKTFDLRLTKQIEYDRLNDMTKTYTYSSFEKYYPKKVVVSYGGGVSETTEYTISVDSAYNAVLPTKTKVTWKNSEGSESTTSTIEYNSCLTPVKTISLKGTNLSVTTKYTYDKFGNQATKTTTAKNCETRKEKNTYTTSGRFLKSVTSPDGSITTFTTKEEYGRLTKKVLKTGDNTYTTQYVQYDGFGNCLKKNLPDGRTALWSSSYAPSNCLLGEVYMITKTLEGTPTKTDAFDRNGQVVLHSETDADGKVRKIHYKYDSYGRLVCERQPFTSGTPNDYSRRTYSYDSFGRLLKIGEYRSDNVTSYSYSKRKVQIKSPIGTIVKEYDASGRMVKSTENGKSVTFTYFPSGKVKTSKADKLTVSMTYDVAGNRASITDPDVGTIQSTYDAYGREITHTTENGDVIEYSYNGKGLLSSYSDGLDSTSYSYSSNNLLIKESNGAYSCVYSYDKFKRPLSMKETMDGKTFQTSFTYENNYGGVATTVYPSGLTVTNEYDTYGHLIAVKCGDTEVWKLIRKDEKGRLTEEKLAGDVEKIYTYNVDGYMTRERAYCSKTDLMDFSYTYSNWKIAKKQDNLTSNEEIYTYDNLERLSHVKSANLSNSLSMEGDIQYDANNNMTASYDNLWKDIQYGSGTAPHQVSSVTFTNSSASDSKKFTFDTYRMIQKIESGTLKYVYTYRPDHRHCMMKSYKSGKLQRTKYYLGNYEKEVDKNNKSREIHYLCGGSGLAAIYVKNNGKDTLFTAVTDYQNSLTAVMDVATKKVEKFSYKPWGQRRNPTRWDLNVSDYKSRFSRGFCMHEHLPELGIIDMGGRMYDARTCQFLSPDPYMQAPGSWLNHNRYAYCLQNPVMYTDPDGESILAAIAIGAIVGGGINYGIKKYNGQINSVGDAFAAFGWGALGGAAGTYAAVTIGPTLAGAGFLGGFAIGMASSFANSVVLSFGNNRSFGDPVMGPNEMIFNSMLGGLMCGVGNGILSKIAGRNFWNGRYVKTPTPDTELLPQKPLAEPAKESTNQAKPISTETEGSYTIEFNTSESVSGGFSPENISFKIDVTRPNITGYSNGLDLKGGSYHKFPYSFDEIIVKNGEMTFTSKGDYWFRAVGEVNGKSGWYTIGMRPDGTIFHRCFVDRFIPVH